MFFSLSSLLSHQTVRIGAQNGRMLTKIYPYSASVALSKAPSRLQHTLSPSALVRTTRNNGANDGRRISFFMKGASVAGLGLGLASLQKPVSHCDVSTASPQSKPTPPIYPEDRGPPPVSSVSMYELGFGTVTGLCAGVFVKKGAKAVAFFLGGIFVLLQYMGSASLVRVDWGRMATRFENLFYTKDATGKSKPPNVISLWNWVIDFLTADFQPRASFVAGFALGLRVG